MVLCVSAGLPGQGLIYLDYAATSQKPSRCLDALQTLLQRDNAKRSTAAPPVSAPRHDAFGGAREKSGHLHRLRPPARNFVFNRNASEAINWWARRWGDENIRPAMRFLLTV